MAHIKVQRRSMRSGEFNAIRISWLKRRIYSKKYEITNLEIRDARQTDEMKYEFYGPFRPLKKGDMYFTPDGTAFFRANITVPEDMRESELYLTLKTAAEICVKINGKYIGGIDPNRERVLISPYADTNKPLCLEMIGYNRSKPDDERNPESLSVRGCRQIFEGAYLANVNKQVINLIYDLDLFSDIAQSDLFPEDYRTFLDRELNKALNYIDFESENLNGIDLAQKYINDVIYSDTSYRGSGDVALIAHSHLIIGAEFTAFRKIFEQFLFS